MRLGAQFLIQNSKFLIRTAFAVRYVRQGFDKNLCAQHAPTSGKNKEKHNGYTVEEVSGLWSKVTYYSLRKQI